MLELSQAAILQVELSSLLRQSTSESDEHGERLKCNLDEQMHETDPISSSATATTTTTTKPLSHK